ncbi:MAG TPA: Do family serine endopeptidase [Woeseiaceae bacterium]|nr:Do family serine endopeptidase [Woeseiaceae bacterium]
MSKPISKHNPLGPWRYAAVLVAALVVGAPFAILHSAEAKTDSPLSVEPAVEYDIKAPNLTDLIRTVKPAVVSIGVEKRVMQTRMQQMPAPFGAPDDFFYRFFGMPRADGGQGGAAPRVMGQGSGFIIAPDGYIVTNNHVIEDADKISVIFEDGSTHPATLVGTDKKTDLALLKIDADQPLPFVQFGDSDKAEVGNWVVAIGNPFGFGGSATAGIISARGRDLQSGSYVDFLQIDAPINSGNSGGPIFDTEGRVIGINTAIYSPNGGNVGLGFAIPSADAVNIIEELKSSGHVTHGWLGVQIQNLDEELAASLNLPDTDGALVADVVDASPAALGGIQTGDVILKFDGMPVTDAKSLSRLVALADLDHKANVEVMRSGKAKRLKVQITPAEDDVAFASTDAAGDELGLEFAPLDADSRRALGLDSSIEGVVIVSVSPGSNAAEKGLRRGDVIERVNQQAVHTGNDVKTAIREAQNDQKDSVAILVTRGDSRRYISLAVA